MASLNQSVKDIFELKVEGHIWFDFFWKLNSECKGQLLYQKLEDCWASELEGTVETEKKGPLKLEM